MLETGFFCLWFEQRKQLRVISNKLWAVGNYMHSWYMIVARKLEPQFSYELWNLIISQCATKLVYEGIQQ